MKRKGEKPSINLFILMVVLFGISIGILHGRWRSKPSTRQRPSAITALAMSSYN